MPPTPKIVVNMNHTFDTVDYKTAEAEFFLTAMAVASADMFAFQCHLSAYLSASRSTTLALQQFKDIPGFDTWYRPHRERLQNDPVAKYLLDARNEHVHGGSYPVRGVRSYQGEVTYYFEHQIGSQALEDVDIVTTCRAHFITLLEILYDCYVILGPHIDPQQYFTKENFARMGQGIVEAECQVWGFERSSLVEEGYDEDARWHELRGRVDECKINHLFYAYLGKTTPKPFEPEEYADFDFTPEDRGWTHVPAGFDSVEKYWEADPSRRPTEG